MTEQKKAFNRYESGKKELFKCIVCGKEYEAFAVGTNKFCSPECTAKSAYKKTQKTEKRNCTICKTEFETKKYGATHLCSKECKAEFRTINNGRH